MALDLQRRVDVPGCWEVERRNMGSKADLLEAVTGFRELYPTNDRAAWGDMVGDICKDVHEARSSPELVNVWEHTHTHTHTHTHKGKDQSGTAREGNGGWGRMGGGGGGGGWGV